MITNSRTALGEQDTSVFHVFSTSEPNEKDRNWIQPSISQQTFDLNDSLLINGIYVQTKPQEILNIEQELLAMAADADIQRDLRLINEEFAETEMDGLSDEL